MKVRVVSHDPNWSAEFAAEAERIRSALGSMAVAIHHVGSTAIPGISAKPIIDILLEVEDILTLEARSSALARLGYEAKGEFGISGRRFFSKESAAGVRTHQIHAFERGSSGSDRLLAFRDYMIAHPEVARSYSLRKQRLASSHPDDIEAYMDGKDAFIKEHEAKAIIWRRNAQEGRANRSQPIRSETNSTPSAAGSGRQHPALQARLPPIHREQTRNRSSRLRPRPKGHRFSSH